MPKPAFKVEYREPVPVIFQKRKLKRVMIAVPLLLAMALIPIKNNKEYLSKSDMGMWEAFLQSAPAQTNSVSQYTTAEYTTETSVQEEKHFNYYIIGGSFKSEENANKYIQQLKDQGYEPQNLGIFKGLHRIAMKGFETAEEAQKELNSLLYKNPQSGVWISANE